MLCDLCHERDAAIFLEQVSGGQKRKINMCMECAIERGISPDPKSIEASSIGNLFKELAAITKKIQAESNRMCPVCGTSIGEIRKTALLGCPECYAIFKNDIKQCFAEKGVKGTYAGSMPERLVKVRSVLSDRVVLQNKLNDAVAHEDYEKAAMYRDYLRALEKTPVSNGDDGMEESEA